MTKKEVDKIVNLAVKIIKEDPRLTYYEAIARAKGVIENGS